MKIVVVDDHVLIRKSLATLISQQSDIEVIGEAESVHEAVEVIKSSKPDIVILNMKIGKSSGLDVILGLGNDKGNCRFIVLTSALEEQEFRHACQLEVDGYILKHALPEELIYALHLVYKGRKYYDPAAMDFMLKEENHPLQGLTARERQVLLALGQGMNNDLISKKLSITEYTVKKHVTQILSKLHLRDRTEAALYANSNGLVKYENINRQLLGYIFYEMGSQIREGIE